VKSAIMLKKKIIFWKIS